MQPDVHAMTGAYALDALEEFERRQFERHLAECPECTREVDELRATAVRLAVAAAEQPPDRLRPRVMAEIAETGQLAPPLPIAQVPARRRGRVGDWTIRLTAVAAMAAAAVLAVVLVRADQARDAAQAQLAQLQGQYAQVTQLAAAPDAVGASGTGVAGGHAFVVVSQSQDEGVLLVSDLPAVPAGRTYQAWLIGAGNPRSIGLVQPDTRTVEFGDLGSSSKVGLTIEPAGGSPQPTTKPVMVVNMPT